MTAASIAAQAAPKKRFYPITEQLIDALRDGKPESFKPNSPYAASLLPLLESLGWHHLTRDLIESLPHFWEEIGLVELRNILVTLGYESSPVKTRLDEIQAQLYPCLFVADNGEVQVLLSRDDNKIRYYDAKTEQEGEIKPGRKPGTVYLFTHIPPGENHGTLGQSWFMGLLQRFRGMIGHLLEMTLVTNLVALSSPLFIMIIYDKVIGGHSLETLPYLLVGVGILLAGDLGMRLMRARVLGQVAGRLDYLIGVETFRQLLFMPPSFTEKSTVSAQLSRLKQFDSVRDFFTGSNASIVLELPFVALFIFVIGVIAGPVVYVPIIVIFIYLILGFIWLPAQSGKTALSGKLSMDKQRILMQTLEGRQEIKAIGGETVWWNHFRETSGDSVMAKYNNYIANGMLQTVTQGINTLAGVATIGLGTLGVISGAMSMGALIATMAILWRVLTPLQGAFLSWLQFTQMVKSIRQLNQLMQLKVERSGGEAGLMLPELKGRISLNSVSFRYTPQSDPALMGVSFPVEPGETVAIIGESGSGKSTTLKLMAGMYQPQAGSLSFDGHDLRQLNAMDLRRSIAYVPQVTKMFHGTIAQNMRLNNILASDEDIHRAAEEAGVLDDILALPKGFDTQLGDNRTNAMPNGFLRAISIARAFVNNSRIVLLDEPGASLDENYDRKFMQQIRKLHGHRSIIMVTHRPDHIRLADKAVLLHEGSVVFTGAPEKAIEILMERAR